MATPEQLMQIGQQVVEMNNQDKSRECVRLATVCRCAKSRPIMLIAPTKFAVKNLLIP